jgi:predicted alpha/beta-hydrolase family hydrolase
MAETKKIPTPRGAMIEVTVHAAGNTPGPVIVVAPGASCNSKGPLFETIGKQGPAAGFTVVRFEWAYCLKDPKKPAPSDDLKNEIEDYRTALDFAKTLPSFDPARLVIAGKSQGSVVAYAVFRATPAAKALALLTPVCTYTTDEEGKPLPKPLRVAESSYPEMKKDARPILMSLGEQDDLCLVDVLYDHLKDSARNIAVSVTGGDHGYRIRGADGKVDDARTQRNIDAVVSGLFNWTELKIRP